MTEYWDIYDRDGNKTGETVKRTEFDFKTGKHLHLVVHIWIVNFKGEFLIQKRNATKQPMPGQWAATSGSAMAGESSLQAAIREIGEELGLKILPDEITYVDRMFRHNSICDIWKIKMDCDPSTLTLQEEEVSEIKWVSPEQLRKMITEHNFHNYGKKYFDIVFGI